MNLETFLSVDINSVSPYSCLRVNDSETDDSADFVGAGLQDVTSYASY